MAECFQGKYDKICERASQVGAQLSHSFAMKIYLFVHNFSYAVFSKYGCKKASANVCVRTNCFEAAALCDI